MQEENSNERQNHSHYHIQHGLSNGWLNKNEAIDIPRVLLGYLKELIDNAANNSIMPKIIAIIYHINTR